MSVEAIDRFSGPPLAERAFICQQAQGCVVRPGTDTLGELVARELRSDGLAWDAWRRADGRWTVIATMGDASPLSTWLYDPRSRSIQPDDAASHRLASEDVVVPMPTARSGERASTSTIAVEKPEIAPPAPEPAAHEDQSSDDDAPADEEVSPPAPARAKSRKGKRASVPRWDEILFGAGQGDS
jgi:hypothetical protein